MSEHRSGCKAMIDRECGPCTCDPPTPTALTREQEVTLSSMAHQIVVEWSQIVMGLTRNNGLCLKHDIEQLVKDFTLTNDAALRLTISRLERERDGLREQMNAIAHTRTFEQSCQAIADLKQQLAAAQARVRELEAAE